MNHASNTEAPRAARPEGTTVALPDRAVEVEGLTKVYGKPGRGSSHRALTDIDLAIPRGSLFGFLGPNGAGKSTLINILAGLVIKTSGTAKVWGFDIDREMRAARRSIGVVPQELNIDPFFTPRALLELQAGLFGVAPRDRRTDQLLEIVGLSDKAEAYTRSLSGGMRRRLMVAKAMVHSPPVLVLDEPTAGVDVELRRQLWDQVRVLKQAGTTVVLTTHYLEEAEELCDRIAIINHGRIIAQDTTDALLSRMDQKELCITLESDIDDLPGGLSDFAAEIAGPRELVIHFRRGQVTVGEILDRLRTTGLAISDLSTREPDLEDIFIALTRGSGENDPAPPERASGRPAE